MKFYNEEKRCFSFPVENKKLFEVLNELDVTWCDGDALVWDNDWEFVSRVFLIIIFCF